MSGYLFNTDKIKYVSGKKPDVPCILCAIRDGDARVQSYEVTRTETCIVTVNLYPFNPGHLMIFPKRHISDINEINDAEAMDMHRLLCSCTSILQKEFNPSGFNVGYNIGKGSGASIDHIHQHIVPRYENEVGFLDVLAGARIIVVDPRDVLNRLKNRFSDL